MSRTRRKDYYKDDPKCFRDKKKGYKENTIAKKITKTQERAKVKNSLHHLDGDDNILPTFKKHNTWDWN